ncbi:MAG: hypothetical protein WEB60_04835 [Terrimicrobiaceae bacterium]
MKAFPEFEWLKTRRTLEKAVRLSWPVLLGLAFALAVLAGLGVLVTLPQSWVLAALILIPTLWVVSVLVVLAFAFRKPSNREVAKRADRAIGLHDDLLSLSEYPEDRASQEWREAAWKRASEAVAARKLSWKIGFPRRSAVVLGAAVGLSLIGFWVMTGQWNRILAENAERAAMLAERAEAAEEILEDWEEFVEITEDQELKKVFAEAAALREALDQEDPMSAMLAMNQMEAKLSSLQESLAAQSMDAQAAGIAEALEAFEGMGALSAALRNQNYESAAAEAEKLQKELSNPGESKMRRKEALAEMLANESQTAKARGNSSLSAALSKLSDTAKRNSQKGVASNQELEPCVGGLRVEFAKESTMKARGRMASIGKSQLEALRNRLRGEPSEAPPSLCQSSGPNSGGLQAGKGTDGQPLGEQTELAQAGQSEKLTGMLGEGESEVTVSSANSGTAAAAGGPAKADISDYFELSQKAVADEAIPLAHRRTIRTYFERIRPVAETQIP